VSRFAEVHSSKMIHVMVHCSTQSQDDASHGL